MNDYQMTHLSQDRRRELLKEAQEARLARSVARRSKPQRFAGQRGLVHQALALLVRRDPARA